MISAAPPTTPPSAGGGGIKIPIYRDFSVPAPVGLTDGLTAPRVWSLHCISLYHTIENYIQCCIKLHFRYSGGTTT